MKIIKSLVLTSILILSFSSAFAQLKWVSFEGDVPSNAVVGGVENHENLAVCRCNYKGAMHPGKVVGKACNIGYGGIEKVMTDFDILINMGIVELDWIKTDGSLPAHAIQAGKENGKPLYIGRAFHKGGTHPGKVFKVGDNYICNIGYGGKEITYTTFEVLVENHPHKAAKSLGYDKRCAAKDKKGSSIVARYISAISKNKQINEGTSLISSNLKYQTRVTDDGRLVIEEILDHGLCEDGRILVFKTVEIWSNTTEKQDPAKDYYLKFQEDGNLCIYSTQDGFVWCSMSNGKDGHHFEITNIGHIEIVNSHGGEVWPD